MADIAEAIKRARESRQGYLGSRFGAPAESDSESIYIATTRNAWKAAVDVIAAAAVYFGDDEAFFAGLNPVWFKQAQAVQVALAAFAEAMGEKP